MTLKRHRCLFSLLVLSCGIVRAAPLELKPGDHISIIGNTLAERMQHDGWLETYVQSRFPAHNLVVRDLGVAGDELTLRIRSAKFGTPDEWLARTKTDVVLAMFGYGESFGDESGLGKFKQDLTEFIKHTREEKYNGQSPPRLVICSPVAHEKLADPNLNDPTANNRRLELYTAAMADVCRANDVAFVDLFHPSRVLYQSADAPLTINGVHLNEVGNRQIAGVIDQALFGDQSAPRDEVALEKLRQAVRDKNFYWFQRYRTLDGYSIYGGRADLQFVDGQTNRVVMDREMEVLDVMTANRDRRIWAVAEGSDQKVDDDNTPPFIPVVTNKPGSLPGGKHVYLDGDEAIGKMTLAKGMKANLFASEKQFPELANPVQMSWDTQGRLWVAVWPTYPHWKPKEPMNDKLLILEDTNGDGRADKCTTFVDDLHCPTGFEFYKDGVIVAQAPYLELLRDTNGDDKVDQRQRVLAGLDSADTHHTSNSFVLDPGGALYFQEGTFHNTQVETPWGPNERCSNAGVFRYEPRAQKFDVYITHGFANPHGHIFERWGQDIVIDGTGSNPYHAALFSGHLNFPEKHPTPPTVYQQRTRPCPGMEILSSRHFPEENQGNLLVGNVIGFQGILQYKLHDDGASFGATEVEPILSSTDISFRPSDMKVGPDGAIYFIDWHNPIIGHMQHNLRDPSRDREHGRIYRVSCQGRPLLKPAKISGESIVKLLDLLKEPEDRVRYRTRIELGGRDSAEVMAATSGWVDRLDKSDPEFEHHRLEALWLHQNHNVVDAPLLEQVLASKDFRARAAATRVLCYWRDRVSNSLELLKTLAADPHPRVRLEAVRAASFFTVPEAIEVSLIASDQPSDQFIDYVRGETMNALNPYVKQAIAAGHRINFTTPAGSRYFLRNVNTEDLVKLEPTPEVARELLFRPGVRDEFRRQGVAGIAKFEHKSELAVLLETVRALDAQETAADESVLFDLVRMITERPAAELHGIREDLESLAAGAKRPVTRQLGYVALVAADGETQPAWTLASKQAVSLLDLAHAVPLIRDPGQRASLYPQLAGLLKGLPPELASAAAGNQSPRAQFVRIELPGGRRTLTLAEVEVNSDGRNVAPGGKATQGTTAFGGDAAKGIDGNKQGSYSGGGQTHSEENVRNPWWEVDLGAELPIESIVVYNRTDEAFGSRLAGFTLKGLDKNRKEVFTREKQPAPDVKAEITLGGQASESAIRHASMNALASVRGQEAAAFKAIGPFVASDADRTAAIAALLRIPTTYWPAEEAQPLVDQILAYIGKLPTAERTSPPALEAMQVGDALTALLPPADGQRLRRKLGELGVKVIRLGTVTDQMRYDKDQLVVQAGRPLQIVFENTDLMPHNLVITEPGSMAEVGMLAEAAATQPGAVARNYVPASNKILLSSRLLQPRESQQLAFTAPTKPGVYAYVCTYPGHWRRMYGSLYVVDDLEEYLTNPETYVAQHKLVPSDELLKYNRPRTEWKLEDLAGPVEELAGRSFSSGKQLFQVASCIACHKLGDTGQEFGPDLAKLDAKQTSSDVLLSLLEPSKKIDDKYASFTVELDSGKVLTGMIMSETDDTVKLIENPLAKAEPLAIKKSEIVSRTKAASSIMPKGLLDKLTREEILDLIGYVSARGDASHKLFHGAHDHGHGGH